MVLQSRRRTTFPKLIEAAQGSGPAYSVGVHKAPLWVGRQHLVMGADCLVVDEVVVVGKEEEVMEWEVAEGREKKRNYRISGKN